MQAMLLAAGFGTRLRPYTLVKPKPLFPVLNVALLDILLEKLILAGCSRIVVNCHHLAAQVEAAVADRPEVVLQFEPEILGTGGSLRQALPLFDDGPVLVMNGDIYHKVDLDLLMDFHNHSGLPVTMAMHDYPRFNRVQVTGDRVVSFGDASGQHEKVSTLAFTGIHVLEREIIQQIPDSGFFHIIDLYKELASAAEVGGKRVDGSFWRDIGTPDDYLELHRELLPHPQQQEQGTCSWLVHPSAKLARDVKLADWGVIGPDAIIGAGAILSRSVVWQGAMVKAGQQVIDAIVYQQG